MKILSFTSYESEEKIRSTLFSKKMFSDKIVTIFSPQFSGRKRGKKRNFDWEILCFFSSLRNFSIKWIEPFYGNIRKRKKDINEKVVKVLKQEHEHLCVTANDEKKKKWWKTLSHVQWSRTYFTNPFLTCLNVYEYMYLYIWIKT